MPLRAAVVAGLGAVLLAGCGGKGAPPVAPPPARLIAFNHFGSEVGLQILLVAADGSSLRPVNAGQGTRGYSYQVGFPAWSPDGKRLAFTGVSVLNGGPQVYVVDARGTAHPRPLAAGRGPVWSADGTRIAYTGQSGSEIFVTASDGSGPRRLVARGTRSDPTWSPDGRRIAFVSDKGGPDEIDVVGSDGRDRRRLTGDPAGKSSPTWSPDGRRILFLAVRGNGTDIEVIRPDGGGRRSLAHVFEQDRGPAWSPRGRRIAFAGGGIDLMAADGSGRRHLTADASDNSPAWSPDGTSIAFVRVNEDGGTTLYTMRADGTRQLRLTYGTASVGDPVWQPGG